MSANSSVYSVLLPTYNERENLPLIVALLVDAFEKEKLAFEIVIVDDNSPDGTLEVARELQRVYGTKQIKIISRSAKLGLGSAYVAGLAEARGSFVLILDADLSHNPRYVAQFVAAQAAVDADVVSGTRYDAQRSIAGVCGWNLRRRLTSTVANWLAQTTLGITCSDCTGSFRLYKRQALEKLIGACRTKGYAFQMEMVARASATGMRIAEVPIVFVDRQFGESKLGGAEVVGFLKSVGRLFMEL